VKPRAEQGVQFVPTELAALATGVSPATVRKWASRGRITRYGTAGRAQYDLQELLALVKPPDDSVNPPNGSEPPAE
jgi:hypothetical protein